MAILRHKGLKKILSPAYVIVRTLQIHEWFVGRKRDVFDAAWRTCSKAGDTQKQRFDVKKSPEDFQKKDGTKSNSSSTFGGF